MADAQDPLILFHQKCPDGWESAMALLDHHPNARLGEITHGPGLRDHVFAYIQEEIDQGHVPVEIIFADIQLEPDDLAYVLNNDIINRVTVIDHHTNSMAALYESGLAEQYDTLRVVTNVKIEGQAFPGNDVEFHSGPHCAATLSHAHTQGKNANRDTVADIVGDIEHVTEHPTAAPLGNSYASMLPDKVKQHLVDRVAAILPDTPTFPHFQDVDQLAFYAIAAHYDAEFSVAMGAWNAPTDDRLEPVQALRENFAQMYDLQGLEGPELDKKIQALKDAMEPFIQSVEAQMDLFQPGKIAPIRQVDSDRVFEYDNKSIMMIPGEVEQFGRSMSRSLQAAFPDKDLYFFTSPEVNPDRPIHKVSVRCLDQSFNIHHLIETFKNPDVMTPFTGQTGGGGQGTGAMQISDAIEQQRCCQALRYAQQAAAMDLPGESLDLESANDFDNTQYGTPLENLRKASNQLDHGQEYHL